MAIKTLLTVAEFERLPDDGMRHELDEGELVTMPPPKFRHSRTASRILKQLFKAAGGEVLAEAGFVLKRGPDIVRQPDVAYIAPERALNVCEDGYFEGRPRSRD